MACAAPLRHSLLGCRFLMRIVSLGLEHHSKATSACSGPHLPRANVSGSPSVKHSESFNPRDWNGRCLRIRSKPLPETKGRERYHTVRRRSESTSEHFLRHTQCTQHESSYKKHKQRMFSGKQLKQQQSQGGARIPRVQNIITREKAQGLREGTHGAVQTSDSKSRFLQTSSLLRYPQKLSQ